MPNTQGHKRSNHEECDRLLGPRKPNTEVVGSERKYCDTSLVTQDQGQYGGMESSGNQHKISNRMPKNNTAKLPRQSSADGCDSRHSPHHTGGLQRQSSAEIADIGSKQSSSTSYERLPKRSTRGQTHSLPRQLSDGVCQPRQSAGYKGNVSPQTAPAKPIHDPMQFAGCHGTNSCRQTSAGDASNHSERVSAEPFPGRSGHPMSGLTRQTSTGHDPSFSRQSLTGHPLDVSGKTSTGHAPTVTRQHSTGHDPYTHETYSQDYAPIMSSQSSTCIDAHVVYEPNYKAHTPGVSRKSPMHHDPQSKYTSPSASRQSSADHELQPKIHDSGVLRKASTGHEPYPTGHGTGVSRRSPTGHVHHTKGNITVVSIKSSIDDTYYTANVLNRPMSRQSSTDRDPSRRHVPCVSRESSIGHDPSENNHSRNMSRRSSAGHDPYYKGHTPSVSRQSSGSHDPYSKGHTPSISRQSSTGHEPHSKGHTPSASRQSSTGHDPYSKAHTPSVSRQSSTGHDPYQKGHTPSVSRQSSASHDPYYKGHTPSMSRQSSTGHDPYSKGHDPSVSRRSSTGHTPIVSNQSSTENDPYNKGYAPSVSRQSSADRESHMASHMPNSSSTGRVQTRQWSNERREKTIRKSSTGHADNISRRSSVDHTDGQSRRSLIDPALYQSYGDIASRRSSVDHKGNYSRQSSTEHGGCYSRRCSADRTCNNSRRSSAVSIRSDIGEVSYCRNNRRPSDTKYKHDGSPDEKQKLLAGQQEEDYSKPSQRRNSKQHEYTLLPSGDPSEEKTEDKSSDKDVAPPGEDSKAEKPDEDAGKTSLTSAASPARSRSSAGRQQQPAQKVIYYQNRFITIAVGGAAGGGTAGGGGGGATVTAGPGCSVVSGKADSARVGAKNHGVAQAADDDQEEKQTQGVVSTHTSSTMQGLDADPPGGRTSSSLPGSIPGVMIIPPPGTPRPAAPTRQSSNSTSIFKKFARFLQDNRMSGGTASAERLKTMNKAQHTSNPILKKILNIIFLSTGVALLLAVVVVIIYTSIGKWFF